MRFTIFCWLALVLVVTSRNLSHPIRDPDLSVRCQLGAPSHDLFPREARGRSPGPGKLPTLFERSQGFFTLPTDHGQYLAFDKAVGLHCSKSPGKYPCLAEAGFEPGSSALVGGCANHCATKTSTNFFPTSGKFVQWLWNS